MHNVGSPKHRKALVPTFGMGYLSDYSNSGQWPHAHLFKVTRMYGELKSRIA